MSDAVNKPAHYQFAGFEVIDLIRDAVSHVRDSFTATLYGNVIKYIFRWPRKDGVRDLKKARWYLDALITHMELREGLPPPPDFDPASVAFRHSDPLEPLHASMDAACAETSAALRSGGLGWLGEVAEPRTAVEIADADGCMEYGNPVTPGCAPWVTTRD